VWNFVSSSRPWPSGVRTIATSAGAGRWWELDTADTLPRVSLKAIL
jgi:hypothetical protein